MYNIHKEAVCGVEHQSAGTGQAEWRLYQDAVYDKQGCKQISWNIISFSLFRVSKLGNIAVIHAGLIELERRLKEKEWPSWRAVHVHWKCPLLWIIYSLNVQISGIKLHIKKLLDGPVSCELKR